jgi:AcrR family transcriptional regulator
MSDESSQPNVPPSQRAEATSTAIVETAERLFRSLGYQKTTVADIARDLRMSPANVYRFFPSKSAINEAVCARITSGLQDRAWAIARGPGAAEDRLRLVFAQMQQDTMALLFHERRMHDMVAAALEEHWGIVDSHIQQIDRALRHIVMDGQAEGRFARTDPETTARMVHATMISFTHPTVVSQCGDPSELPQQASLLAEFVIRALRLNKGYDEC